ncbi:hypothetical protein GCM10023354_05700 [Garicola koreensis]
MPNPFQDYSARDYADALWNLETSTYVRTYERESGDDCDTLTYEVSHPLGLEAERTFVHISDEDDWWCSGDEADELREEFDERDDEDENFYHGRPYENVTQREPYFGTWADVTGNGVSSRTEIHARDLGNATFSVSGTYRDHYSGEEVNIAETETHGEHMIPVGHTWPEMQHRSREERVAYYNDAMNLTSTVGSTNREKAGHTPSEWMPSDEDAHCAYAMTWTHSANKHRISLYQRDVDHLRQLLWGCLEGELGEELDGAETRGDQRSDDLDWQSLPPDSDPAEVSEGEGGGPGEHYTTRDYTDAVWNLENYVRVRSVEREEHEDCDVQTYTTAGPRGGSTLTYARVISPENTYCSGEEGDELREELQQRAEDDAAVFHSSPMDGNRRDYFGYWSIDDEAIDTRNHVLARDLTELEWNATQNRVIGGEFSDPYTGEREDYGRAGTRIDHIMGVEHAWVEMEHRDDDERRAFYNDPANLLATSAGMLRQKNADAPRNWMPDDENFHCRYAMAWVHNAVKHEVSLFASDIDELRGTLYRCIDQQTDEGEPLQTQRRAGLEWTSLPPY